MKSPSDLDAVPDNERRVRVAKGPTRVSWAWFCLIIGIVLGAALLDFLLQNTGSVRIEFFSVTGHVPITVALLSAALAGGAIVIVVGIARMAQLRRGLRVELSQRSGDQSSGEERTPGAAEDPRS